MRRAMAVFIPLCLAFACTCQSSGGGAKKASDAAAKGPASWESAQDGQVVELEGRVRRVGAEPFSRLVLTDAQDRDWSLDDEAQKLLLKYEQKRVKVSATVRMRTQILANGKRLPDLRELTNARLVE